MCYHHFIAVNYNKDLSGRCGSSLTCFNCQRIASLLELEATLVFGIEGDCLEDTVMILFANLCFY